MKSGEIFKSESNYLEGIEMLKIQTGRIIRPQKIVIYGSEGIGKTSLAA